MHKKPKKYLGQNFLIDKNIQRKIISSCEFTPDDTVLEIGSGRGELTSLIWPRVKKLFALEVDTELIPELRRSIKGANNVKIINEDILKFDLRKIKLTTGEKIKVIGNIPYYISSPILGHLFKFNDFISNIFITIQKEFAYRLSAVKGTKSYGALSCFVQYYREPQIIMNIKKTCFSPVPKVDSAFVWLKAKERKDITLKDETLLFRIIKTAFTKRRKILMIRINSEK
jgi:16S rRNA (adenine1518-N6/adenine1519-N6)-dimethyltransferase